MTKPYHYEGAPEKHPFLVRLNGFKILKGAHSKENEFCLLECASEARGRKKSDNPSDAGLPDFRIWNDAYADDEARTRDAAMVAVACWSWPEASNEKKQAFVVKLAELVIRRILPISLRSIGLTEEAERCENEGTRDAAYAAARATYAAAYAADAADVADVATYAAARAADAATYAAASAADAAAYAAAYAAARAAYAACAADVAARAAYTVADKRNEILATFRDCVIAAAKEL